MQCEHETRRWVRLDGVAVAFAGRTLIGRFLTLDTRSGFHTVLGDCITCGMDHTSGNGKQDGLDQ